MNIKITRNPNPATPPTGDFGFGSLFTPHMFVMEYTDGEWGAPRIQPYQNFSLDPAAKVLHYGQEIFEGMKAYKNGEDGSVHMFRPDKNIERFNISCERMCMPKVDPVLFEQALEMLIDLDRDWVPESPNALYIRPTMISTQVGLGVLRVNADRVVESAGGVFFVSKLELRETEDHMWFGIAFGLFERATGRADR